MSLDIEIRALLQTSQVQEINFNMRGIRATEYYLENGIGGHIYRGE